MAFGLLVLLVVLSIVGTFLTPWPPSATPGIPFSGPSRAFPLGTDYLGSDVLSRVLAGGWTVVCYATLATIIAYTLGGTIGLVSGYSRTLLDPALMRSMDVLLAFPPILFLLLLATDSTGSPLLMIAGIAAVQFPGVARVVRSATLEVSVRGYVEAAVARGDSVFQILRREIVPNIAGSIAADAGPRLTTSILLAASLNFLGLGLSPPAADWALMVSENRGGLLLQPWAALVPALMIGALTVSVNTVADAFARSRGHTVEEALRR